MNVGLIGFGRISKHHINSILKNSLSLVAVCDKDIDKLNQLQDSHELENVKIYQDYLLMLKYEKLDIVAVATSSEAHSLIAIDCMLNGVNLVIEKPVSLSLYQID